MDSTSATNKPSSIFCDRFERYEGAPFHWLFTPESHRARRRPAHRRVADEDVRIDLREHRANGDEDRHRGN